MALRARGQPEVHICGGSRLVGSALTGVGAGAYIRCLRSNTRSIPFSEVRHVTKRFDEEIRVERDAGMPSVFEWRGRRYDVVDVIGRWRIEGRWWADGRDREYWRVEARGGAVWDLYFDRGRDRWHMERLWD
jgi:hypothetical protein